MAATTHSGLRSRSSRQLVKTSSRLGMSRYRDTSVTTSRRQRRKIRRLIHPVGCTTLSTPLLISGRATVARRVPPASDAAPVMRGARSPQAAPPAAPRGEPVANPRVEVAACARERDERHRHGVDDARDEVDDPEGRIGRRAHSAACSTSRTTGASARRAQSRRRGQSRPSDQGRERGPRRARRASSARASRDYNLSGISPAGLSASAPCQPWLRRAIRRAPSA
jgi:hypothetical protein